LVTSNLCQAFWCKQQNFTANGSKFTMCKTLYSFSGTPCTSNESQ